MPILFCNTAWMKNYAGRYKNDPPLGGGGHVIEEGEGGDECNFVHCDDGFCYGYFETLKNETDRQVAIEKLGAETSS